MKTIIRLVVCLLLVTGWGLAALSLHVIRTPDEIPITLVPKDRLGITDTYVDTCNWTVNDAVKHPLLVQKLISVGKIDVLRHIAPQQPASHAVAGAPSTADLSRLLDDAVRSAQHDAREKSISTNTVQAARGLFGWF